MVHSGQRAETQTLSAGLVSDGLSLPFAPPAPTLHALSPPWRLRARQQRLKGRLCAVVSDWRLKKARCDMMAQIDPDEFPDKLVCIQITAEMPVVGGLRHQ
jgi:hypothetical protein